MKKLIAILLLSVSASAMAQHHWHGYHDHRGYGYGWVAPAIIGGALVYGMTRPAPTPPPSVVVVQPQNQLVVPYAAPAGFHWEQILDANCNCYRLVLVQG